MMIRALNIVFGLLLVAQLLAAALDLYLTATGGTL